MDSNATPPENTFSDDSHRHKSIHSFYVVKMSPYEDPNLAAADKLIHKLNQQRVLINESRSLKMLSRDQMDQDKLHWERRYRNQRDNYFCHDNKMKMSQLCLDKLQFANNSCRGRAIKPSSSVKEIDHHSLHFGLIHGSKKLSEEKQILRKIKEVGKKLDLCISVEDYNRKIALAQPRWFQKIGTDDYQQRFKEAEKLKLQKEEAIEGAALHGKMWDSLGSKQNHIQQIQSVRVHMDWGKPELMKAKKEAVNIKKQLLGIEKHQTFLEKQSICIGQLRCEVAEWIPHWDKQQQEKNVCYGSYIKLMIHAKELAENKQVVAVQSLSHKQVEEFMTRWNTDKDFRYDYQTRSIVSLNKRCFTGDGRHRNRVERN